MTTPEKVSYRDALDIVFANRNRAYGAYQLRREYPNSLARAMGIALWLIALFLLLPRILAAFAGMMPEKPIVDVISTTSVINVEKPVPLPVMPTPPPPLRAAIGYTPPIVAPDEDVPEERPQDVQSLLDDPRDVGNKTVEGPDDEPPTLDPASTGLGVIETPKPVDDEPVDGFTVSKMPSFPGGESEMFKWIYKNIAYPEMAREAGTQGSVVLTFVVGKDGAISDIVVVKTPAGGTVLGKEATRVIKLMPNWSPGEINGRAVKVRFTLPIRFTLK